MISKSKLGAKLGAVAFVAAIGVAYPAFAANYGPNYTGGGSAGYNNQVAHDYRLGPHHGAPRRYYNYEAPGSAGPAPNVPGSNCPPMCWRLHHHK
jgi:hypothetical protein